MRTFVCVNVYSVNGMESHVHNQVQGPDEAIVCNTHIKSLI